MLVRYSFVGYGAVMSDYFTNEEIGGRQVGDTMIWHGQRIIILDFDGD